MISFIDFLLVESFKSDVDDVYHLLSSTKSISTLETKLKSWAKKRGTPIKLEIIIDQSYRFIDVAGAYYAQLDEEDKTPVSITIQLPNANDLNLEVALKFVTAVDHEWQHAKQSRSRDFIPPRSVSRKYVSDKAKYLANSDEIDSYAKEVANEIGDESRLNFDGMLKKSQTLKMYVNLFGRQSKEVKTLLKKAVKFIEKDN